MKPEDLQFPLLWCQNQLTRFGPANRLSPSWFTYLGGPLQCNLRGKKIGPAKLHRVLTVSSNDVPELRQAAMSELPLFYGMRYDACELVYEKSAKPHEYSLLEMNPRKSKDSWPYLDYPNLLPYVPMKVKSRGKCTFKQFSKLAWQGIDYDPKYMMVIVPPYSTGGVSLWGPMGDMEGVQIIFVINLADKRVAAFNQCS